MLIPQPCCATPPLTGDPMLKHIVLWKLKDEATGHTKKENALRIKNLLEDLNGRIDGLIRLEVGFDIGADPAAVDIALYSEFVDRAALDRYQTHPLHEAVKPLVLAVRESRTVVDYEVS